MTSIVIWHDKLKVQSHNPGRRPDMFGRVRSSRNNPVFNWTCAVVNRQLVYFCDRTIKICHRISLCTLINPARRLGSILFWATAGGSFYRNTQFMCGRNKNRGHIMYFGLINSPKINHNVLFYMIREKRPLANSRLTV